NGVDAKLPADSPDAAWSLLAKLEREQHLLARDITVIDLRLPDRLVVKVGPAVDVLHPDQAKQPGSSTGATEPTGRTALMARTATPTANMASTVTAQTAPMA